VRTGLAILLLALLCVFAIPAKAYAREPFFAGVYKAIKGEKDPDPSLTLQAPFIKKGDMDTPTADKMGLPYNYYDNQDTVKSLAAPHRDKDEVAAWLTRVVSEILSVKPDKYERHLKGISAIMSPSAVSNYDSFMQESDLLNAMRNQRMELHAFVEEEPLLLNKGVMDNRYQWLYIMPATVTLLSPMAAQDYERSRIKDSSSMHMQLRILVSRTEAGEVIRRAGLDEDTKDLRANSDGKEADEYNFEAENEEGLIIENLEVHKNPFGR
jgi:hypothetical protein